MQIGLVDYEPAELFSDDIKELEELYVFYKEACEDLKSLINSDLDINEYWDIIDRYYNIELFESENDTIMDCHKLGIKPKRLLTDFILYEKDTQAPKFYFEDWIIMETGKVDTRKIYSEDEIDNLLDEEQMVVLYPFAYRPASKRLQHVPNDNSSYDLTCNGKFVIDESELDVTCGELENITYYKNWLKTQFSIFNSREIQSKMRKNIFTREKLEQDIASYRFRALQVLKLIRNLAQKSNLNLDNAIKEERVALIKK